MADVIAEPLSVTVERSWKTGEVVQDWKGVNVLIFKKGKRTESANYRPMSLALILGKILDRIMKVGISNRQHVFINNRLCQTSPISFLDRMTKLVIKGTLWI